MKLSVRLLVLLLLSSPATQIQAQSADWESAESNLSSSDAPTQGRDPGAVDPNAEEAEGSDEDGNGDTDLFDPGSTEDGGQLALWAELALFAGGVDYSGARTNAFATSPLIGAAYSVTSRARISAQWGFIFASNDGFDAAGVEIEPSGSTFRFGNPLLSADLLGSHDSLRYRVGVGVALPVARANDLTQSLGVGLAMAMRGGFHPWLWMPDRLSLVGTGRVEGDLGEDIVVGGDAALAILIGTGNGATTNLALEAGADGEYHATGPLFVGLRLTMLLYADLVPSVSRIDDDNLLFALMPYARFLFGHSFVTAGFEINLDTPFGSSFSGGGVWALRAGFGTVL
jgi:hypothetical protein